MQRHPIESNFYANVSDTEIEVTFAPTRSVYRFSRTVSETSAILPDPVIQHLAKKGDTGDYAPTEVQAMACRVALATIKRLHLRHTVIQLWPYESRRVELARSHLVAA
jgi:hypothetical protein